MRSHVEGHVTMDITNMTLAGLVAIGAVNALTFFDIELESKDKFLVSFAIALIVSFVPAELGNYFLDKIKIALEVALGASGVYKLAQKSGGV